MLTDKPLCDEDRRGATAGEKREQILAVAARALAAGDHNALYNIIEALISRGDSDELETALAAVVGTASDAALDVLLAAAVEEVPTIGEIETELARDAAQAN